MLIINLREPNILAKLVYHSIKHPVLEDHCYLFLLAIVHSKGGLGIGGHIHILKFFLTLALLSALFYVRHPVYAIGAEITLNEC